MKTGGRVKILECHATPGLVGLEADVVGINEKAKYQVAVLVNMTTPLGLIKVGPFFFREDELEPLTGETKPATIPDEFLKAFENKPDEPGKTK